MSWFEWWCDKCPACGRVPAPVAATAQQQIEQIKAAAASEHARQSPGCEGELKIALLQILQ